MIKKLLRIAAAAVCLGMGFLGLVYDLPLRTLLWDPSMWSWFANFFGYSWTEWVTDAVVDQRIGSAVRLIAAFLSVGGLMILFVKPVRWLAWSMSLLLLFLQLLIWKGHFYRVGQLLELSLQTAAPLVYYYWTALFPGPVRFAAAFGGPGNLGRKPRSERGEEAGVGGKNGKFWWVVRLLIVLTFIGHGLYAVGYYPVPAPFILMTQSGLGVGEAAARLVLLAVGILDFLAAGALLLPYRAAVRTALCWIIPWAVLTTLARLWSYGGLVETETLLWQWGPEVVRRLPHILIPLALWYAAAQQKQEGIATQG